MKRFFFILFIISFATVIPSYAQTDEQLHEWMQKGQNAAEQGDYQEAVKWMELYRERYSSIYGERNEDYKNLCSNLLTYYYYLGDYAKAVELGKKALIACKANLGENHPDYSTLLNNVALCYSNLGDYANAIEMGIKVLEKYKMNYGENHPFYAAALNNVALYYCYFGDYKKALEMGVKAAEIQKNTIGENHPDYAMSLSNLGVFYSYLSDYRMAEKMYIKSLEIRKVTLGENHSDYALSLVNLSNYYNYIGDYTKAVEIGTQASELYKVTLGEEHPTYAKSLNNLALCYSSLGNNVKAIQLATKAMDIQETIFGVKHPDYAMSLHNLAMYYCSLGDLEKAVEMEARVLDIRKEILGEKHPDYAISVGNLANYYEQLGDYKKAVEMGRIASGIFKDLLGDNNSDYATVLNNLARFYSDLGDYVKAIDIGEKALEIRKNLLGENHIYYATSLGNLARYYAQLGDYDRCLNYYGHNISIFQSNILQLFSSLTTTQRNLFWKKYSYQFTNIFPNFIYQSHKTTAPDLYDKSALFAKGLLLSTEIEMNRLIQESGDEEALQMFEELQMNRMQLQKLYETPIAERHINTDSLAQVVDRQEQALVKRSKAYGDFTQKLRTTWQDVQGALKEDEIAVEFLSFNVWGTDSTMVAALTLRKDDAEPKFIPLFEQRQLQEVSDQRYYHCPELTSLVWQPLQQELKGIKRIYFSPAGVLHNIGVEYAPGMESYEMYRLSTTREIITKASPGPSQGGEKVAALYGGVDYNASISGTPPSEGTGEASEVSIALHRSLIDSLNVRGMTATYLPATLEEVQGIKASFDKKKQATSLTTGKEATETSVKTLSAHSPKILHIATHGFYFTEEWANYVKSKDNLRFLATDDSPSLGGGRGEVAREDKALTRSGLLMAGANGTLQGEDRPLDMDDGVLTAQEISRLDLRGLDLVVLSACKTGNGDINQGEGVFGLQRGFKKAGAQTLVMSLWEVDDEATQILMTAFYDNLLQGRSKRDAFHNAQRILRTTDNGHYDAPRYWAAFILLD